MEQSQRKWDWWCIGGRWRGFLRLLPGKTGYREPLERWEGDVQYDKDTCDSALAADCDFSVNDAIYRKHIAFWERAVEGKQDEEITKQIGQDEELFLLWSPEYYKERYGTKEYYAKQAAQKLPYAFVTAEGEWFGQGQMGWFGIDDADQKSLMAFEEAFIAYLEQAKEENLTITVVDCHI